MVGWPGVMEIVTPNLHAYSALVSDTSSARAADELAARLCRSFAEHELNAVIVYATVNHDQIEILRRLRARLGAQVALLGCSVQGIVVQNDFQEGGFLVAAMGFGGADLRVAPAFVHEVQRDTRRKGELLARAVTAALPAEPRYTFLCWDPQSGLDTELLIEGLRQEIRTPIVGGAAGQPFGRIHKTYQYFGEEVTSHAAMALGLTGPFGVEVGVSGGTSSTGVVMTLTQADGARLIQIDGRPALEVWREVTGYVGSEVDEQDYLTAWAVGVERAILRPDGTRAVAEVVLMAIAVDPESGALIAPTTIAEGTRMVLHHRTASAVVNGARAMAHDLASRVGKRRPWAVLGFECCARTSPFIGQQRKAIESAQIQQVLAPSAPWLGMMAWGEVAPLEGTPVLQNFAYPLVVLAV